MSAMQKIPENLVRDLIAQGMYMIQIDQDDVANILAIEAVADKFKELGLAIEIEKGEVAEGYPLTYYIKFFDNDIKRMKTRGAGRKKKTLHITDEIKSLGSAKNLAEWFETHAIKDVQDSFKISQASAYRLKKSVTKYASENPEASVLSALSARSN